MEDPKETDPRHDRLALATQRVRESQARASQAQEQLTLAIERLAEARRALREAKASEAPKLDTDRNPMDAS